MSKKLLRMQMLPSKRRSFEVTLKLDSSLVRAGHAKCFIEVESCIVGRGLHSERGEAKLGPAIMGLMRKYVGVHSASNQSSTNLICTDTSWPQSLTPQIVVLLLSSLMDTPRSATAKISIFPTVALAAIGDEQVTSEHRRAWTQSIPNSTVKTCTSNTSP